MTVDLLKQIKIFKPWVNFTDCHWLNMIRYTVHCFKLLVISNNYLSTRKINLQKKTQIFTFNRRSLFVRKTKWKRAGQCQEINEFTIIVCFWVFYAGGGLATCSIQVLQWVEGFPWNFKSAGARIAGNSAANDEGRALAARWCDKKCHGGIPYQVSYLLISA
jgi:hypothetical protein